MLKQQQIPNAEYREENYPGLEARTSQHVRNLFSVSFHVDNGNSSELTEQWKYNITNEIRQRIERSAHELQLEIPKGRN